MFPVIDLTEPDHPRKENPYNNRNKEEATYANAPIMHHTSNPPANNNTSPERALPVEPHANRIPVAKVQPSVHQRPAGPPPTEYENVQLRSRGPIPVGQLATYIKEKKTSMTDSLKQEYSVGAWKMFSNWSGLIEQIAQQDYYFESTTAAM